MNLTRSPQALPHFVPARCRLYTRSRVRQRHYTELGLYQKEIGKDEGPTPTPFTNRQIKHIVSPTNPGTYSSATADTRNDNGTIRPAGKRPTRSRSSGYQMPPRRLVRSVTTRSDNLRPKGEPTLRKYVGLPD